MSLSTVDKGRRAERAAADYLAGRGMRVVANNVRTPSGELDLVCRQGDTVVFVEVKARSGRWFGNGLEAVTPAKMRRLRASASWWLTNRRGRPSPLRFDVVTVDLGPDGTFRSLAHLRDVT